MANGTKARNLFLLPVLLAGCGWISTVRVTAQKFTTLYSFTGSIDGKYPRPGLILSGSTLYGVAFRGGSSLAGSVFAVQVDGSGFATLYSFTGGDDGALPSDGLVLSGSILYG